MQFKENCFQKIFTYKAPLELEKFLVDIVIISKNKVHLTTKTVAVLRRI